MSDSENPLWGGDARFNGNVHHVISGENREMKIQTDHSPV